jgi:MSHA pilin protein MshD
MRQLRRRRRAGFSMAETMICIVLVGVSIAASMRTVGATIRQRGTTSDKAVGMLLGQQLLSEILEQYYKEPSGTAAFGPETGEAGSRSLFDDVDDYNGWSEAPPKDLAGATLSGLTAWKREVLVEQVSSSDAMVASIKVSGTNVGYGLRTGSPGDSGVKRVTVTIKKNNVTVVTLKAVRTDAWPGY